MCRQWIQRVLGTLEQRQVAEDYIHSIENESQEVQKLQKCLQNSTNSYAFEPDHELSKSIIGATQGPRGGCRAPPGTTQAPGSTLPSVPGNVPGAPRKPRNSPRTLSRLPKRREVSKKGFQSLPKASQEVPGGPRRQTET